MKRYLPVCLLVCAACGDNKTAGLIRDLGSVDAKHCATHIPGVNDDNVVKINYTTVERLDASGNLVRIGAKAIVIAGHGDDKYDVEVRPDLNDPIKGCLVLKAKGPVTGSTRVRIGLVFGADGFIPEDHFIDVDVEHRPVSVLDAGLSLLQRLDRPDPGLPTEFETSAIGKLRVHSDALLAPKKASAETEIVARTMREAPYSAPDILVLETDFPEGQGPHAFTVKANIPAPAPEGDWYFLSTVVDGDVPLNSTTRYYQFGFAFDGDNNPLNNYKPSADFPNDYFQNTDQWYVLEYGPGTGWQLKVTDAGNNAFIEIASAARAMIRGNTVVLAVPKAEFDFLLGPFLRQTAFCHTGDFGLAAPHDWFGDYEPELEGTETLPPGSTGEASPEAQMYSGDWYLRDGLGDMCIDIRDGRVTRFDRDCMGDLVDIASSKPGRTENGIIFWEFSARDGTFYELSHDPNPLVLTPTFLFTQGAGDPFGQSLPTTLAAR